MGLRRVREEAEQDHLLDLDLISSFSNLSNLFRSSAGVINIARTGAWQLGRYNM
jgi:hypothetical protein